MDTTAREREHPLGKKDPPQQGGSWGIPRVQRRKKHKVPANPAVIDGDETDIDRFERTWELQRNRWDKHGRFENGGLQ